MSTGSGLFSCDDGGTFCHFGAEVEPGSCQQWHCGGCGCIQGGGEELEVVESAATRDLVTRAAAAATRKGNAGAIVALLKAHGDRVRYNSSRAVVQVQSCGGKVVAQFGLPKQVAADLD